MASEAAPPESKPETESQVSAQTDTASEAADPEEFIQPAVAEQIRMVEAVLFASPTPLSVAEIARRLPVGSDVAEAVRHLEKHYAGRGVVLTRVADKWLFRTASDLSFLMQEHAQESRKLSKAALETLAIIAYHQPATRADIEAIRGVTVSRGTIDFLMELGWIKLGNRLETPGRPVTFLTTDDFLTHFDLASVKDLPGLEEFKAAGLMENRPSEALSATMLKAKPTEGDPDDEGDNDDGVSTQRQTKLI